MRAPVSGSPPIPPNPLNPIMTPLMTLDVEELPYRPDSATVFAPLAARPWSVWLDSGRPGSVAGRWDILACDPWSSLVTRGGLTWIRDGGVSRSRQDPLDLLRRQLGPMAVWPPRVAALEPEGLPFGGGAIGWFGYDLGRRFERLPATALDRQGLPDMALGLYDWALLVDHARQRTWLAGRGGRSPQARERLRRSALAPGPAGLPGAFRVTGPLRSNLTDEDYRDRFQRVQAYIQAGDCYQVNLARRFSVKARGDPWAAYLELRRHSPAPFAAWLNTPGVQILSASPERFLRVREGRVETCPIKGTAPRLPDPVADQRQRQSLAISPKDRAENIMIVDLLRNDLGRNCAIGSIQVPDLFAVETFAQVHHLVSRVIGRLAPGVDGLELLRGCFPGGSITGAPKIRAMEVIEELEGERRGVYCGCIGYLGHDGALDTSITIRTLTLAQGELSFWAGGGLVADSQCEDEAAEIAVKARAMRELVESFRRDDSEEAFRP